MYQQFRQKFLELPIVSLSEIRKAFPDFDTKNLINWQKKGYMIKLRNGYYLFSEAKTDEYRLFEIANKLYDPSYVSMESALNYYGIIPEAVYSIQSISTRKTVAFTNKLGTFNYRAIKKALYFGYHLVKNEATTFRMASREKAILDFLYLRPDISHYQNFEALRWNREELLLINESKLQEYMGLYDSPTLNKKLQFLKTYLHA